MAGEPVLLVAMPWEMLEMPSIQLGTLASLLRRAGIGAAAASLKLPFWDACLAAGVPYFYKQQGGRTSKSGGRVLDGRTWDELPRLPAVA